MSACLRGAGEGARGIGYSHVQAGAISGWFADHLDDRRIQPKLGHLYMRDSASGETVQLDRRKVSANRLVGYRAISEC